MQKIALIVVVVAAVCVVGGIAALLAMQEESYGIDYELNGGEFLVDHPKSYIPGRSVDIPSPMKDGYISAGFYTDAELTDYFDGNTQGMEGVLKLYARWIESPVGQFMTYSQEGECDRGFSSYTLTGTQNKIFYYYSTSQGTLYTSLMGRDNYYYTEVHEAYSQAVIDIVQSPGYSKYAYLGKETLDTLWGEKVCDKYLTKNDNGSTTTIWVDGYLIYKECYDYIGTQDSDVKSEHITRILENAIQVDLPEEGSLSLFTGDGISVSNFKGQYKIGDVVTLTAEVAKGKSFGGWYDAEDNLLSDDKTYSFEFYAPTSIYAMNNVEDSFQFEKNVEVDLDKTFGLNGVMYTIYNLDAGTAKSSESPYTFTQCGLYKITTGSDGGNHAYWAEVAGDVTREYTWNWNGNSYSVMIDIDYEDYQYAKNYYDFSERRQQKPSHDRDKTFVELSYQDPKMSRYTEKMTNLLIDAFKEKNTKVTTSDYLNYLLAFVQYIQYQTDEEYLGYAEYWKFPLETLFDEGGDCEDTAILYVAIAHKSMERLGLDYDVALQILPGHMCVAVKSKDIRAQTNPYGYVYGETTAKNYKVGDVPDKVRESFIDKEYYPNKSFTVEIERSFQM